LAPRQEAPRSRRLPLERVFTDYAQPAVMSTGAIFVSEDRRADAPYAGIWITDRSFSSNARPAIAGVRPRRVRWIGLLFPWPMSLQFVPIRIEVDTPRCSHDLATAEQDFQRPVARFRRKARVIAVEGPLRAKSSALGQEG
jgi:hypothetical protein